MGERPEAVGIGDVGPQTIRHWMMRFNARGPNGFLDGKSQSSLALLNYAQCQATIDVACPAQPALP